MKRKVKELNGIGEKKEAILRKMNINTIEELLYYFPRTYEDRGKITKIKDICEDGKYLVEGKILSTIKSSTKKYSKVNSVLKIKIGDPSGEIVAVFFNANYIANTLKPGDECLFWGQVKKNQMISPEYTNVQKGLVPTYSLTKGMGQQELRRIMKNAIDETGHIEETLPEEMLKKNNLCSLDYALNNIHFPASMQKLKESLFRMNFEELLSFQIGVNIIKNQDFKRKKGKEANASIGDYEKKIPFALTESQKKVIKEICDDLEKKEPMNRLLQGDVGSGKTIVAEISIYKTIKSNLQAVLMAPTEILARQHYGTIKKRFDKENINVRLLTGSINKKEKAEILEGIRTGEIDLLIGTHALIEHNVVFKDLGLVITDEQHRFGVTQRALLSKKGGEECPNILVMTATPIPRTLGVILYGDLDISIIDAMPINRKPIITKKLHSTKKEIAYDFMKKEIEKGRQIYIVAPLIENSEEIDAASVAEIYEELNDSRNNFKCKFLHGGMKDEEKKQIMDSFVAGEIDVLISTIVIEVGINVPNATLMIIESANRFGLSQLHQLRGRVGRGSEQSYCILIYDNITTVGEERINTMLESTDGFYISEKDLELRGVGDIFGTMQHGFEGNRIYEIAKNMKLLEKCQKATVDILGNDPMLLDEKNSHIKKNVEKIFGEEISFIGKI